MKSIVKYFTFLIIIALDCLGSQFPEVTTKLGKLRGTYRTSHFGRTFAAFEGVPYAKPPIGNLRFEPPQEVEPWPGIWEANTVYTCIQLGLSLGRLTTFSGHEDCLYLNIYTPSIHPSESDNFDVIVHIHAGAYMVGSANTFTKPNYIMDRDVVFVTFNYRVGSLGFLSSMDDALPGNNGLKDQAFALKWVHDHIQHFGGNPNSVTLSGFSSGSTCVHYHYLSPLSKGLFHRGYSYSGTALHYWSLQLAPVKKFKILADILGCNENSSKAIVECLKTRPATQIVQTNVKFFPVLGSMPFAPFGPVVEKNSSHAFLTDDPETLFSEGKINDVPWINSFTLNETAFIVAGFEDKVDELDKNWDTWISHILNIDLLIPEENKIEIARKIRNQYLGQGKLTLNKLQDVERLLTDKMGTIDSAKASLIHTKGAKAPVYSILYNYRTENDFTNAMGYKTVGDYGVGHGDDIILAYGTRSENELSESDKRMKKQLLDLIVSYVKTGIPTINGFKLKSQPKSSDVLTYTLIAGPDDFQHKLGDPFKEARKFWDSLLVEYNRGPVLSKDEL